MNGNSDAYDPHDVSQWEGKTFVTENSEYSIREGKLYGRKSLEGAEIAYINGVSRETWGKIAVLLQYSVEKYSSKLMEQFDKIALELSRVPEKGRSIVIGISDESAEERERVGLATSRLFDVL